jgi:hypothetical protein
MAPRNSDEYHGSTVELKRMTAGATKRTLP